MTRAVVLSGSLSQQQQQASRREPAGRNVRHPRSWSRKTNAANRNPRMHRAWPREAPPLSPPPTHSIRLGIPRRIPAVGVDAGTNCWFRFLLPFRGPPMTDCSRITARETLIVSHPVLFTDPFDLSVRSLGLYRYQAENTSLRGGRGHQSTSER